MTKDTLLRVDFVLEFVYHSLGLSGENPRRKSGVFFAFTIKANIIATGASFYILFSTGHICAEQFSTLRLWQPRLQLRLTPL
jgi:hypothetical protein